MGAPLALAFVAIGALAARSVAAGAQPPSAVGFWVTGDHGAVVEIASCEDGLCGRIAGLRMDLPRDEVRTDQKNPDPAKRGRPLCGLSLIGALKPDRADSTRWKDGWIYDPESGGTYSAEIRLEGPATLKLRGFLGSPCSVAAKPGRARQPPRPPIAARPQRPAERLYCGGATATRAPSVNWANFCSRSSTVFRKAVSRGPSSAMLVGRPVTVVGLTWAPSFRTS
jgi:uncharacterized protein (DUF2147 family)